ncbi:hypothetical protein ACIKT0_01615 [Hansschlegelia beijingensis]|uniref:hypothetical protein n=1 Tax=Hansschlegelia beijingensis TaxID=1133344 RepID=UPI00387F0C03
MKQAIEGFRTEMAGVNATLASIMRRDRESPPVNPQMTWFQRYGPAAMGIAGGIIAVLLTWSLNSVSTANTTLARQLETMNAAITENKNQGANNAAYVGRVDGSVQQLTQRLESGQAQRIENDRQQFEKMAGIDSRIAVLSTKQDVMNATLERLLRKLEDGRRGDPPFGENQIWPYPTPEPPFVLRARSERRGWSPVVEGRG